MTRVEFFFIILFSSILVACQSGPPPTAQSWHMSIPLVSKNMTEFKKGKPAAIGNVKAKYCVTEGELTTRMGIVDQLVKKALEGSGGNYISSAEVTSIDSFCATLIGKAINIH
jgi:hypothetical protein